MQIRCGILCAALLGAAAVTVGCSKSPYELAPVHGRVTIDNRPLAQAKVMFAPVEIAGNPNPGKPAFGLIKDDGQFVLTTYKPEDGAIIGEHWVTIINLEKPQKAASTTNRNAFSRLTLSQRITVHPDQDNALDLKLTAQDVAKSGVIIE